MSRRRAVAATILLTFVAVLAQKTSAYAEFRGTDMWSNLMPSGTTHGLAERYPLAYYQLDYYVDGVSVGFGGVDASNVPASMAQFISSMLFFFGAVLMRAVIAIFDWSSGLDLITGPHGGLNTTAPVAQRNYTQIVAPFMTVALVCLGVWVAYKAVTRKGADVWSVLGRVVLMSVIAIAITFNSAQTIGRLYSLSDDLSEQVISLGQGKQTVSDRMFETFVYRPAAILQFGTLDVCTGARKDDDDFPLAATDRNPAKVCHSVLKRDSDGHGDYMRLMMQFAPGSDERKSYYEALRDGKQPEIDKDAALCPSGNCPPNTGDNAVDKQRRLDNAFDGVKIDRTDSPAVDPMQAGAAVQRLAYTVIILFAIIAGVLLLGLLVIARAAAQVGLLFLFQLSPFMIIAAILPATHGVFWKWLKLLGHVLVAATLYAVLLSITMSTSAGLMLLGGTSGYLIALLFQTILFGGVFLKRKAILNLVSKKTADHHEHAEHATTKFVVGAGMGAATAMSGVGEAAMVMRTGWKSKPSSSDNDSVTDPTWSSTPTAASAPAAAAQPGAGSSQTTVAGLKPFSQDLDHARQEASQSSASAPTENMDQQPPAITTQERDDMPTKTFREELADTRARQYDQRDEPVDPSQPITTPSTDPALVRPATPPPRISSGISSASSFSRDLEQERRERELDRRE